MPSPLTQFERHQLDVIARVTPHAMGGHVLNTTILAAALAGSVPTVELIVWCSYSYAIALVVLYRHVTNRGRVPQDFRRATNRATIYALFLALPWSAMAVLHLGELAPGEELILVALGVGMAASGTILLSAVPAAAYAYMSGILIPGAVKCLAALNQKGYLLLGLLALSYWWFLAALIAKITREIRERKQADIALNESEARLQEALMAGHVVAFTWDPRSGLSQRSANTPQILGQEQRAGADRQRNDFLARVHSDDRGGFAAQIKGLRPDNASYSASFRFIRPDGREVWLEETGNAEFDAGGRLLRLRGLTQDITDHKQAQERQRLLVRELDHRVKNALASVAAVAQRARESSGSMDDFLKAFDGRIQSMAGAHAMLSRSQWHGVKSCRPRPQRACTLCGRDQHKRGRSRCVAHCRGDPTNGNRAARACHQCVEVWCVGDAARPDFGALGLATGRTGAEAVDARMDRGDARPRGRSSEPDRLWRPHDPQPHSLRA